MNKNPKSNGQGTKMQMMLRTTSFALKIYSVQPIRAHWIWNFDCAVVIVYINARVNALDTFDIFTTCTEN